LEESAEAPERRVALGFPAKIPLKAGCKPALQLFCPAPFQELRAGFHLVNGPGLEDNVSVMFGSSANDRPDAPMGVGEKLFLTLFGAVFLGAGLLVGWLFLRDAAGGLQTWTWRKTACEITASAIRQQNQQGSQKDDFFFEVKFRYTFGGRQFSSDQYKRSPESSEDYSQIARLTERYPPGSSAVCYVNPSAPERAVLVRYNLFHLLLLLFPVPFVAFGGWAVYYSWFRKSADKLPAQPISDRAAPPQRPWVGILFLLIFLLAGGAGFYAAFLRPAFKILGARSWPAVPCVVISSEVKGHDGSGENGSTYSVNIFYTYQIKGREFKSNSYGFMGGSSSGYDGKQAVVARYPPGTRAVCYVNPEDPADVVLERGFTPDMWFGLIPLVFVLIGSGGLCFIHPRRLLGAPAGGAAAAARAQGVGAAVAGPAFPAGGAAERIALKPAMPRWAVLLGVIFICLFWNGIVSAFVVEVVSGWRAGHPDWWLTLFMVPFVVIGLGFVGAVLYCLLALLNPRPRLTVTPGAVPLGGTLQVQWNLAGRAGVLQNLRLRLEGFEEVTPAGDGSNIAKSIFADLEIANVTTPREIRSGEARVTVPAGLVPSFAGGNHKIIWAIHVHGPIALRPDVKEVFPVTVLPAAPAARPPL
jgi:hypothetical protein